MPGARQRDRIDVIERKWNAAEFDPSALKVFRSYYPQGKNNLVVPSAPQVYAKSFSEHEITVCSPAHLASARTASC
jgi:hypothetical protein